MHITAKGLRFLIFTQTLERGPGFCCPPFDTMPEFLVSAGAMPANLPTHKKGIYLAQEMALVRDFQRSIRLEIQNGI